MEMYSDRLEREVKEFKVKYPNVDKVIKKIQNINNMPSFEFDYNIEKTHLMFIECIKILNK